MKTATVYGGGLNDRTTPEYKDAIMIGKVLVEHAYRVKCGGYRGIMEAVSKGVSEAGGTVTGNTLAHLGGGRGNEYLSETIVSFDLYGRLQHLIEGSELFIVCRGGTGTLAELFLTLDLVRKMKVRPRIVCVDFKYSQLFDALYDLVPHKEMEMVDFVLGYQGLERFLEENKL